MLSNDDPGLNAPPPVPPLGVGVRVRIAGIKTRPELNGEEAVCLGDQAEKVRWLVRLETTERFQGEVIALKERCLFVIEAASPQHNLDSSAEPCGTKVEALARTDSEEAKVMINIIYMIRTAPSLHHSCTTALTDPP